MRRRSRPLRKMRRINWIRDIKSWDTTTILLSHQIGRMETEMTSIPLCQCVRKKSARAMTLIVSMIVVTPSGSDAMLVGGKDLSQIGLIHPRYEPEPDRSDFD